MTNCGGQVEAETVSVAHIIPRVGNSWCVLCALLTRGFKADSGGSVMLISLAAWHMRTSKALERQALDQLTVCPAQLRQIMMKRRGQIETEGVCGPLYFRGVGYSRGKATFCVSTLLTLSLRQYSRRLSEPYIFGGLA